jgi:hypothetical protein
MRPTLLLALLLAITACPSSRSLRSGSGDGGSQPSPDALDTEAGAGGGDALVDGLDDGGAPPPPSDASDASVDAPPDAVADLPDAPDLADGGDDTGPPSCELATPQAPFMIGALVPGFESEWQIALAGPAVVSAIGPAMTSVDWDTEIRLQLLETGQEIALVTKLPHHYRLPLILGETVRLVFARELWFESIPVYLAVWGGGGPTDLRAFVHDAPPGALDALLAGAPACADGCPGVRFEEADCPPDPEGDCGVVEHPPLTLSFGWGPELLLRQGDDRTLEGAQATVRTLVGRAYRNLTMDCLDYPDAWAQVMLLNHFERGQCVCRDRHDCAQGEVCETEAQRCVPNRCLADGACPDEHWCDVYTGACFEPPPGPIDQCVENEDCPPGGVCQNLCHTYLGLCQTSPCCLMDCLGSCSGLLQGCYQCLSDCDCAPDQVCEPEQRACRSCLEEKIGFTQDNPSHFELVVACLDQGYADATRLLAEWTPWIQCGGGGFAAGCDPEAEIVCQGTIEKDPLTGDINAAFWHDLCRLSRLPFIRSIVGTYWM